MTISSLSGKIVLTAFVVSILSAKAHAYDVIARCSSGNSLEWIKHGGMNLGSISVFKYGAKILSLKVVRNGADHTTWGSGGNQITLGSIMSGASITVNGRSETCRYIN